MTYVTEVLADNPYVYWKMNETSGNATDFGTYNDGLVPFNGVVQNAAGAFSGSGTAWQFDGTNDYAAEGGGGGLYPFTTVTIEMWLYWNSYGTGGEYALGYSLWPNASGVQIVPNHSSGAFLFGFSDNFRSWIDSFIRPSAAAWHHYAFVFNNTAFVNKGYVDGSPVSLTTVQHDSYAYTPMADDYISLMSYNQGAASFGAGRMQHVAIYGSEISSTRILAHYNAATGGGGGGAVSTPVLRLDHRTSQRLRR